MVFQGRGNVGSCNVKDFFFLYLMSNTEPLDCFRQEKKRNLKNENRKDILGVARQE